MPRHEPSQDADYYFEPTRAASYGASAGYGDPYGTRRPLPPPRTPWYRRAPALVAAGALAVLIVAGIAIAAVKLTSGPRATSVTTSTSSAAPPTSSTHREHSGGGGSPVIETVPPSVDTAPPATDTGTPTTAPQATDTVTATSTAPADTSVVTQTQTVTVPQSRDRDFQHRPGQ